MTCPEITKLTEELRITRLQLDGWRTKADAVEKQRDNLACELGEAHRKINALEYEAKTANQAAEDWRNSSKMWSNLCGSTPVVHTCSDGQCGAADCARCRPEWHQDAPSTQSEQTAQWISDVLIPRLQALESFMHAHGGLLERLTRVETYVAEHILKGGKP